MQQSSYLPGACREFICRGCQIAVLISPAGFMNHSPPSFSLRHRLYLRVYTLNADKIPTRLSEPLISRDQLQLATSDKTSDILRTHISSERI
jgi:hypothetical protein